MCFRKTVSDGKFPKGEEFAASEQMSEGTGSEQHQAI